MSILRRCEAHLGFAVSLAATLCAVFPELARGDAFSFYQFTGSFSLPTANGPFDVLNDGRLIVLANDDVYLETAAWSQSFSLYGTLPSADLSSFGAAFIRVSPDGTKIAVGNNGGASFSNYQVGAFVLSGLSGTWFSANHFDGEWIDETHVALTAGDFSNPSIVTILDTTSPNPGSPVSPTVVNNIGGASAGIAFDAAGNLYTGNGFVGAGPSGTGAIKAFSNAAWTAAWMGGPVVNFETDGFLVVDILSASPMGFDAEGNLFIGGGDFSSSDVDFAALVRSSSIAEALAGMGAANPSDINEVRQLDPDPANDFNYFYVNSNDLLGQLYVREGALVHVYQAESPFATVVVEYRPAPGQFVHDPLFNDPQSALGPPSGGGTSTPNNESIVTLGGFGGYIVLAFDHTVLDDPMNAFGMDAIVFGNAHWVSGNPQRHWAECATVEISRDANENGEADDAWYLIPGSHLPNPLAARRKALLDDGAQTWAFELPAGVFAAEPVTNPITDGSTEGIYGYAEYTPALVLGDTNSDNIVDRPGIPAEDFYTRPDDPLTVGISNRSGGGDAFDIAWAIDAFTGHAAELDGFDFLRVTTAVDYDEPPFGERSAEIDAVADVAPDPFGDTDEDVDIDLFDVAQLQLCFLGAPSDDGCDHLDSDGDAQIENDDVTVFVERMTGPR